MIKQYKEISADEIKINMIRAGITQKHLRLRYCRYSSTSSVCDAIKGRFPGLKVQIVDYIKERLGSKKWIKL